jgi:hypothetical protein
VTDRSTTDRTQLIMDLGALQRDATLRGDDRAVAVLSQVAKALLDGDAAVAAIEERRSRENEQRAQDAERKRRSRHRMSRDIRGHPVTSGLSSDGSVLTQGSSVVELQEQQQQQLRVESTPRARSAESAGQATPSDGRTEGILAMLSASAGDYWPDVDRFLCRRPYVRWAGWGDEMLRLAGPGSQFTWADLAAVCRDDEALTRPVESPKGFRTFVVNARIERVSRMTDGSVDGDALDRWAAEKRRTGNA